MSVRALIHQALESGVTLRLVGSKVVAGGTQEAVTDLLPHLRKHRRELAEELENAQKAEISTLGSDSDRWCWPYSKAMNGTEIDTFTARLARFTDKGLTLNDGEALADKLVARDRESDNRRVCLECLHLNGQVRAWRCTNCKVAGVAVRSSDSQLTSDFVVLPQRCDGFVAYFKPPL